MIEIQKKNQIQQQDHQPGSSVCQLIGLGTNWTKSNYDAAQSNTTGQFPDFLPLTCVLIQGMWLFQLTSQRYFWPDADIYCANEGSTPMIVKQYKV